MPQYRQLRCSSQAEAVKALNKLNAQLTYGVPINSGRGHTVSGWLDVWLKDHIKPNREPKTHAFYSLMSDKHIKPYLGRMDIQRVTSQDINLMYRKLESNGASPNTISAVKRTLRAAYGVALKHGVATVNPVINSVTPKVKREPKVFFDSEQIQRFLVALAGSPIENIVKFTLATGVRVGEASGVTWRSVNLKEQTVLIDSQLQREGGELILKQLKTEKGVRTMPLVGHSLEAILNESKRQEQEGTENPLGLVFLNSASRPFDSKNINTILHAVLQKAGLPSTGMHSLRHSAATFLLMEGLNLHQVSRYLGHSQIALTSNLYGHVLDGAMREAAEKLQGAYSNQFTIQEPNS